MTHELITKGAHLAIYALVKGTRCEAKEFLDACASDKSSGGFQSLFALLERIAEYGPPKNPEQFKQLQNGIYEIKAGGIRLFCFFTEDRIDASNRKILSNELILTHGWKKGPKREQNQQIERAARLRTAFLQQQGS